MNDIELSKREWDRVLVGLTVYANSVERNGNVEKADEIRALAQQIAVDLKQHTEGR